MKKPPAATAPAAKKPAAPATSASGSKGGKSAPAAPNSLESFKYKHTPEDAEALAAEAIPGNMLTEFGDANWKVRLAALEEMTTWLEGEVENVDAEVIVRALAKKGWNEKNFQVRRVHFSCKTFIHIALGFKQAVWNSEFVVSAMS